MIFVVNANTIVLYHLADLLAVGLIVIVKQIAQLVQLHLSIEYFQYCSYFGIIDQVLQDVSDRGKIAEVFGW